MVGEVRQLGVWDVEADFGLRAEFVGKGSRDVLIGTDALADDEDSSGAQVLAAARAGGDLSAHGTVQAGVDARPAGERAQ